MNYVLYYKILYYIGISFEVLSLYIIKVFISHCLFIMSWFLFLV